MSGQQLCVGLKQLFLRGKDGPAVKWLLKIQPLLAYVATLPCETLVSHNKRLTINYKAVQLYRPYLRYGGVVNNQTKKG